MTETIEVIEEYKGIRIDKFLVNEFKDKTRGEIIRMINSEAVLVNDLKIKPSYRLKGGEKIEIGEYEDKATKILANKNIELDFVENNENFVIINKQRGLQVHPSHREREKTLVNALLAKFPEIKDVGDDEERPGIVHRLDKDTTGLMVVAKNQDAFDELKKLFQDRKVQKTYHALVFGLFDELNGEIDAPIARATSYTKQKIAFGKYKGDSKEAQTRYNVINEYNISEQLQMSCVEVSPKTGRTHQIRVHMAHKGHPLIGDSRYYTKNERKIDLSEFKDYNPDTFYLHAKKLAFELGGEEHSFEVEYPQRFHALLKHVDKYKI